MKKIVLWVIIALIAAKFAVQLQKVLVYSETAMLPPDAESYKVGKIIDEKFPEMKNNTILFVELEVNVTSTSAWRWYWSWRNETSVNVTSIYDMWKDSIKGLTKLYSNSKKFNNMYKGLSQGLDRLWAAVDVTHYIMVVNGLYELSKEEAVELFRALAAGVLPEELSDLAGALYDAVHSNGVDPLAVDESFTLSIAYTKMNSTVSADVPRAYLKCLYANLKPLAAGKQYWLEYPLDYNSIFQRLSELTDRAEPSAVRCFARWFAGKLDLPAGPVSEVIYSAYLGTKPDFRSLALELLFQKAGDLLKTLFVSQDWKATTIRLATNDYRTADEIRKMASEAGRGIVQKAYLLGPGVISEELQQANVEDAERVQSLSHVLVLAVLFALTRSLVASIIPFVVVGIGIVVGMAMAYFLGLFYPIYHIARTLMVTTGLGLGLDYSIFILARFKEEAVKGLSPRDAARVAAKRAGHAVAVSAVAASLGFLSLALSGTLMLDSMGVTIPLTVVATALAAITLLPEILAVIGEKRWFWWPSKVVVREEKPFEARPREGALLALFLATLVLTAYSLHFYINYKGTSNTLLFLPEGTEAYESLVEFSKKFPPGAWGPIYVVAPSEGDVRGFVERLSALPGVAAVIDPTEYPQFKKDDVALIVVVPSSQPFSDEAADLVARIRSIRPEGWLVGGTPAEMLDTRVLVTEAFWTRVAPFAIAATAVVLAVATRRARLVVGAAYSLLAAISWAVLISHYASLALWGYELYWITPLLAFVATLGIGTDYNVFFISRVVEELEKGSRNPLWAPLKSVAPVILGLASIMASAYFGMLIARSVALRQMGLALGFSALFAAVNAALLNPVTLSVLALLAGLAVRKVRH
ncbi:MAG: MMPL family transporter [Crenarchaeota archaeon]|nr:MMPL family transporter [Thermoproteota archaeon]